MTAYINIIPEKIPGVLEASRKVRLSSISESGCERYDFFQSPDDPSKVVFVEEWTSMDHLSAHFEQAAFKEFFGTISPMLVGPPDIRIFEATLSP